MKSRKALGLSKIATDHIKMWYKLAFPKKGIEPCKDSRAKWDKVVELVQLCLKEGEIPKAFSTGVLVMILKNDKGDVRGIGLLETIHKIISLLINIRMNNSIHFCKEVHGFRRKQGCFTAIH